jgi:hypothetical protein
MDACIRRIITKKNKKTMIFLHAKRLPFIQLSTIAELASLTGLEMMKFEEAIKTC